jgi:hypothetical protein
MFVPVVDKNQKPLMPTRPKKARKWIASGKATPFWKRGVFMVRLNVKPSARNMQPIVVGIDPGSKAEGLSVKSKTHTYLNIEADSVTWVKDHVKQRRQMRRTRRYRNTPCRANRSNRKIGGIPPSTKARWQWKLRICWWLKKLYPITSFVIEDIRAWTRKGKGRWNRSFSPLEVGKRWFYAEISKLGQLVTMQGYETKAIREALGLKKDHWADAWCLAYSQTQGNMPDNRQVLNLVPLRFHRRQLHRLQPEKGGIHKPYGGTRSLGFKRGSLVKHPAWGLAYVGGWLKNRISLHGLADGKRLCQNARPEECKFLTFNSWRMRLLPALKNGVSAA